MSSGPSSELQCIYCSGPGPWSDEHVLSEFLGCRVILPEGVCKSCNDRFGGGPEGEFYKRLLPLVEFCGVPAGADERRAKVWSWDQGDHLVPLKMAKDRTSGELVHPVVLKTPRTDGRTDVHFIGTEEMHNEFLKNLARKAVPHEFHKESEYGQWTNAVTSLNIASAYDAPCLLAVTKYAANFCLRVLGRVELTRTLAQGAFSWLEGHEPGRVQVGPFGDIDILNRLGLYPPNHKLLVAPTERQGEWCVIVVVFGLLPFYVRISVGGSDLYYAKAEMYGVGPFEQKSSETAIVGEVRIPSAALPDPGSPEWQRAMRVIQENCKRVLPSVAKRCAGIELEAVT